MRIHWTWKIQRISRRRASAVTGLATAAGLICLTLLFALTIRAQDGAEPAETAPDAGITDSSAAAGSDFIVGRSDEWFDDPEAGTRTLTGKVIMDREDGSGYLHGDKVTMYHDPDADSRAIERTVAEGSVNLKEGDVVATCDRAVFTEGNNVIHLTGSVVVLLGRDRMECEDFTLDGRTGERHGSGGVRFRVRLSDETALEETGESHGRETDAPAEDTGNPSADTD